MVLLGHGVCISSVAKASYGVKLADSELRRNMVRREK